MRNTGLDEAQAGIQTGKRNNLRYADDATLMAESEEELKSLLMKVKEESENASLKLYIQKTNHGIRSHHLMANRREKVETVKYFIFLSSQISVHGDCNHEIKRRLVLGRKAMTNLDSKLKSRDITLLTNVI